MPRTLSDILRRFRPAATPGPAAPAGVPADRLAEADAELRPVFEALEPAVTEAARSRFEARSEADRRQRAAADEAERIVAGARARVDAERAAAAAAELGSLADRRHRLEQEARAEIDRVHRVAEATRPALVDRVVAQLWDGVLPAGGGGLDGDRGAP